MAPLDIFALAEPAAVAAVLGLARPESYTDLKLADAIAGGVPARSAETIARRIDPTGRRLTVYDIVAKAKFHRRKQAKKPLSRDDSERLWHIARVYREAMRQYRDETAAVAFLFRPHPLLEGRRPIDLVKESAAGAALVLKVLEGAEAGVAV